MARKHHPLWVPDAVDRRVAAAVGGAAAFLPVDGGWAFVRGRVEGPRSPVLDLVQAVYAAWPDRAQAVLRQRIRATVLAPFDRDVVKVAAKRVSLVAPAEVVEPVEGLVELGVPLVAAGVSRPRIVAAGVPPAGAAGGVVATLYDLDGTAVLTAHNAASLDRTLHAELALAQRWWARTGGPIPAGFRLETSLQCCRMCAAVLVASVAGPIEVVYAAQDPGPFARGTALQRLGWERPARESTPG